MLVTILALFAWGVMAQDLKAEESEVLKGTHQFLMIGHSHLSKGVKDNGRFGCKEVPQRALTIVTG